MRKIFMLCLLSLFLFVNPVFANEADGFRGINWGEGINKDVFTCQPNKHSKNEVSCTKQDDILKIGGADLNLIAYSFYKNMFSSVGIKAEGTSNCLSLFKALQNQFGYGYSQYSYLKTMDNWRWNTSKSFIFYDYNQYSKSATVFIFSKEIRKLKEKDQDAEASNSSNDF